MLPNKTWNINIFKSIKSSALNKVIYCSLYVYNLWNVYLSKSLFRVKIHSLKKGKEKRRKYIFFGTHESRYLNVIYIFI